MCNKAPAEDPSYVLQIDETIVAIDPEIAKEIHIRKLT
jgi:hypothetical protein